MNLPASATTRAPRCPPGCRRAPPPDPMPTRIQERPGSYPVRVSLNVSRKTSDVLDHLEQVTANLLPAAIECAAWSRSS